MRRGFTILAATWFLSATSAIAGVVALPPVADNTLFEDADGDTSNGAGPALFAGSNHQGGGRARRALIAFDVASSVPREAVIDSVTLRLNVSNVSDLLPRVMAIHRVTSPWGEGESFSTGGTGGQATPGDASWIHAFYPDRAWRQPGGDFEMSASASQVVGGTGSYTWTGPGLVADLMTWLDQPEANHGWMVVGVESEPGTTRRFDSREHQDVIRQPALVIHYSLPPKSARSVTWGSIKAAYR